MIKEVHKYERDDKPFPYKFEGGTPNIADVIRFAAAIDSEQHWHEQVREHEVGLTKCTLDKITGVGGSNAYGPRNINDRGGVIWFNMVTSIRMI